MRLRVCAAAMTTPPIHRSNIHRKWVKAPELVDAEQHGEILHPSSRNHPRNGCFWEMFHFIIQVEDWDIDKDPVPDEVRKGFPEVGNELKASFSKNAPAEIE